MGVEQHFYLEIIFGDEVSKLALFILVVTPGIHNNCFSCVIVNHIRILLKRIKNKWLNSDQNHPFNCCFGGRKIQPKSRKPETISLGCTVHGESIQS